MADKKTSVSYNWADKTFDKIKRFAFEAKHIGYNPDDLGKALIKEEKKTRKKAKSEEGKLKILEK